MTFLRRGPAQADGQRRVRDRLLPKYVAFFVTVVCLALLCNDLFQLRFSIRDYTAMSIRIQQEQADAAATKIGQFVADIESQLGWVANLAWDDSKLDEWRFDLVRLLHQVPPITEFTKIDASGRERLRVSRVAPDVVNSLADLSNEAPFVGALSSKHYYGPVDFRVGSEPYMTLALAGLRHDAGVSVVAINLKFIRDVISRLNLGAGGRAYVVDANGRLIAHSDLTPVLSRADFSQLPHVRAALARRSTALPEDQTTTVDINDRPVLAANALIAPLGWRVFVETPVEEALAPLHAALWRTGFVLVAALILASLAGLLLARRMVVPIRALAAGAARIGSGDLSQRLALKSGDELEILGAQFNSMATQLQESYASLEGKVEERTRELELANLAKSRFIAVASHDLRQPLHALGLFVGQLRGHVATSAGRQLVERIDGAVVNMNELFASLLDISKLDAGVLVPDVTEFPAAHLLERMDATFAAPARAKGLSLRVVKSSLWVRSDIILLERILQNLVSNAVRFAADGGVVVGCRHRGGELRLDVCDSGPGIPTDRQRDVFGEFTQLVGQHQDQQRGLGLGLAIVERLCRLLGHRVELASTPGKGSRFSIFVPLAPRRAEIAPPLSLPQARPDSLDGKLVLVLDDDAMNLESLRGLLASWGCRVATAATFEQALARFVADEWGPDIIISDYHLANGATGYEVIARLRDRFGQSVPAFLMSGDTSPEALREARASGFQLLHKPVPPMKLRLMLNQLVRSPASVGAQS
ncbi:Signal transduction histidine kinase [Rhizobiales bacterium GAS113]|nr:Signal transduction histidine kinase [Rhizobiales bacterium GAS113]